MSVNEIWKLEMKTPFGTQKSTLHLFLASNEITGRMEYRRGASDITDGKIDGDTLMWKASRKFPRFLTFEFNVKVDGDTMSGTVKSPLGKASLKGTRITDEIAS